MSAQAHVQRPSRVSISKKCIVRGGSSISGDAFLLGENSRLGFNCHMMGNINIGSNVMIAPGCVFSSYNHGTENNGIPMVFQPSNTKGGIVIEDDVWIGANACVLSGVTISSGAVVGAGSIVVKNIGPNEIWAGNPARKVGER